MTAIATPHHRISVATAHVHDELDAVADASVWSMDPAETARTLQQLVRAEARLAELKARVAAHADSIDLGAEVAACSTADWLAHQTNLTRAAARGIIRLGHDLEAHPGTREALAAGDLHLDQARAVIRWVDALPDDLDHDLVEQVEAHLLAQAEEFDARRLDTLGKHAFEVIAPDLADAHEAKILEGEEAAAWARTYLKAYDDGHGMGRGEFAVPVLHLAALKKALWAFMAPKHQNATQGAGTSAVRLPAPERMGQAFCELITRYPAKKLPKSGGLNATVVVMIDEDSLMGRIETAGILDTGEKVSPALARRIACEAGIIPAVLGGESVVLDLGRKRRLYSDRQRIALTLRDGGCTAEGCDRTPGMTHAHHDQHWEHGGRTDLASGRLLCPWHHARAHDTNLEMRHLPNGKVTFHRRT